MAVAARVKIHPEVFNPVYEQLLGEQARVQIIYGGSASGKSVFVAQRNVIDLMAGGRNFLCVRNVANTLRGSCFTEMVKVIREWGLLQLFKIRESDMEIACANGYTANFRGLDDVEKLKSFTPQKGSLTDIWIEEATEITEQDFEQLDKRLRGLTDYARPKRITMTFNPILRNHWIHRRFFGDWADTDTYRKRDGVVILKTTYRDNMFLTQDDVASIENTADPYMRDVYRDGNWGVLGGAIYPHVEVADIIDDPVFQTFDIIRYGLDFGFSNDPTAFNAFYYHRPTRTLYIFAEWHAKGVTNDQIADALKPMVGNGTVVCDSAEPKSIAELNMLGLPSRGAQKGKDSVLHGIQWLRQQRIVIDRRCQHTINDFRGYHWKKDKHGESINIPSDAFSHHPDAVRYACEDLIFESPANSVFGAESQVYGIQASYSYAAGLEG